MAQTGCCGFLQLLQVALLKTAFSMVMDIICSVLKQDVQSDLQTITRFIALTVRVIGFMSLTHLMIILILMMGLCSLQKEQKKIVLQAIHYGLIQATIIFIFSGHLIVVILV